MSGVSGYRTPSMQQPMIAHATLTLKGEECYRVRPQIYSYRMMVGCLYKIIHSQTHALSPGVTFFSSIQQATNTTSTTTILRALQRSFYESLTMHTISESAYRAHIVCDENLPWTYTHNEHNMQYTRVLMLLTLHIYVRLSVCVC